MIASPDIYADMKAIGLIKKEHAPRCKTCRGRCEWIHPKNEYCFVCVSRKTVQVEYPLAPFVGRLKHSCDASRPELYLFMRDDSMYKVVSEHPVWRGVLLHKDEFSTIRRARAKFNGFQEETEPETAIGQH